MLAASLSACGTVADQVRPASPDARLPAAAGRAAAFAPAPYVRGTLRPYTVRGRTYIPAIDEGYDEVGIASWYGDAFHGRPTATGEMFDMNAMSAAHTTLPLPSLAEVTNLRTGQSVIVRVNDRGPFAGDRLIDLSRAAADALGIREQGLAEVRVRWLGPAPEGGGVGPVQQPVASAPLVQARSEPPPADRYFVQAGAFANRANAEALTHRLGDLPVLIQPADIDGRAMFRVLVGPWPDRREAERQRSTLAGQGLVDATLVRAQ